MNPGFTAETWETLLAGIYIHLACDGDLHDDALRGMYAVTPDGRFVQVRHG